MGERVGGQNLGRTTTDNSFEEFYHLKNKQNIDRNYRQRVM